MAKILEDSIILDLRDYFALWMSKRKAKEAKNFPRVTQHDNNTVGSPIPTA